MNPAIESDESLVARVRAGESEPYGELIQRYEPKLGRYIRKFVPNQAAQEDVLQDVFIKAYRNLNGFDLDRRFSPWLYRIAHNEALNHIKKFKREPLIIDEHEWEVADERLDLTREMDHAFTRESVAEALSQLKPKYREPLVLFYFEERTYEEIAEILRLPRNTVGTLISRAKNQLKDILQAPVWANNTQTFNKKLWPISTVGELSCARVLCLWLNGLAWAVQSCYLCSWQY